MTDGSGARRRRPRLVARIAGDLLLALATAMTVLAIAWTVAVVGLGTRSGRRLLVRLVLPRLQASLNGNGHLSVGALDGDLARWVVLREVVVRDATHAEAVRLERLAIAWEPLQLLHRTVAIDQVLAEGMEVRERPLADGKSNLASLLRPSPASTQPPPARRPWTFEVRDLELRGRVLAAWSEEGRAEARVRLAADGWLRGGAGTIRLRGLELVACEPLAMRGLAEGDLEVGQSIRLKRARIALHTDGAELRRLSPGVHLVGALEALAHAEGTPDRLVFQLAIAPAHGPRGSVVIDGVATLAPGRTGGRAALHVRHLDPSLWAGLPRGRIDAEASGELRGRSGEVVLRRFAARLKGVRATAAGRYRLDGEAAGEAHLVADDLSPLAMAGLVAGPLAGRVELAIRGERHPRAGETFPYRVAARATASNLAVSELFARDLRLAVELHGLSGYAGAIAHGVRARGRQADLVVARVTGDGNRAHLEAYATAPGVRGAFAADARFHLIGRHLAGLSATLQQLDLTVQKSHYQLGGPARLDLDLDRRSFAVARLHLDGPAAHFRASGHFTVGGVLAAQVEGRQLDVPALVALVDPARARRIPPLRLDLRVDARGTQKAPIVDGELDATAGRMEGIIEAARAHAEAHWRGGRLEVALAAETGKNTRLTLAAHLPMPLGRGGAVDGKLHLSGVPPEMLARAWPQLRDARGTLAAELDVAGDLRSPHLTLTVTGDDLRRGTLAPIDARVTLDYLDRVLHLDVSGALAKKPVLSGSMRVDLAAADLEAVLAEARLPRIPDGALAGHVALRDLDLAALRPLLPAGGELGGRADLRADLGGRLSAPHLGAMLTAVGLTVGQGSAKVVFPRARAQAAWDGARLDARMSLDEAGGGALWMSARLPRDPSAPIAVLADARGFDLRGVAPLLEATLSDLAGRLDTHLELRGTRASPLPSGRATVSGGSFILPADARRYHDVAIAIALTPARLVLEKLHVATLGGGRADASAELDLFPGTLRPASLTGRVDARHFDVGVSGDLVGSLDGRIRVTGKAQPNGFAGAVVVEKGTVHLPAIGARRHLQSTAPLEDVVFVDREARREATRRAATADHSTPLHFAVRVPGPFALRGPEISTDLHGDLDVTAAGSRVTIAGTVETTNGWVDVLGHRFNIDHARIGFSGSQPIDPALDIRVTRRRGEVLLLVDVTGSAARPHLSFGAEPPIYSEAEILALLISDDPNAQAIGQRSLDDKVVGAISGVIVGKIKEAIAPQLPIDVLKLDVGGAAGIADTRVEVGKFITPNIYVSYVHQFGTAITLQPRNSNQATVEWRFARRFELDTTYGDAGVGAADIYFRIRY